MTRDYWDDLGLLGRLGCLGLTRVIRDDWDD